MTWFRLLDPLQPVLSGRWWWVGALAAAVAAWLVLRESVPALRRSADARCRRCGHPFPPGARFGAEPFPRCSECGAQARSWRDAHVRPIRTRRFLASVALLGAVVLPFALWHNVHLFLARLLLPRWVATARAELPDGLAVVHEVDPVQAWVGWEPNAGDGAWHGGWGDAPPSTAPGAFLWPEEHRMRITSPDGRSLATNHLGPLVFGAGAGLPPGAMPAVGTPGFGGDLTGDGEPDLVVGEVNVGSGGGVGWFRADSAGGALSLVPVGTGTFREAAPGEWLFDAACGGFRYRIAPGALLQDPSVPCTWDPLARTWTPDPGRMRADVDPLLLDSCVRAARSAWAECADARPVNGPDAGTTCPAAAAALARGAIHLAFTGHGAGWGAWVLRASSAAGIPPDGPFAAGLVGELRKAFACCACAEALRELNGAGFSGDAR
jgi:hypothetical protein